MPAFRRKRAKTKVVISLADHKGRRQSVESRTNQNSKQTHVADVMRGKTSVFQSRSVIGVTSHWMIKWRHILANRVTQ